MSLTLPTVNTRSIQVGGERGVRLDGDGSFEGWANLFGVVDTYGTHWRAGAWTAGGLDSSPYALLWMHDARVVLGHFTAEEREMGLWIAGAFDSTPEGQAGRARALSGSAPELSVGFGQTIAAEDDPTAFIASELMEVSQITARHASSPGAVLTAARVKLDESRDLARKAAIARARLLLSELPHAGVRAADLEGKDATFVKAMIGHHEAAVKMTDKYLASEADSGDKRVVAWAKEINSGQKAEIKKATKWLGSAGGSGQPMQM